MGDSIINQLKQFFSAPQYDDRQKQDLANVVSLLVNVLIFGVIISFVLLIVSFNNQQTITLICGLGLLILLTTRYLLNMQQLQPAIVLLVASIYAIVTASNLLIGGIYAPSIFFYITIIIIAGYLLDERILVGMTALIVLTLVGTWYLGDIGTIQQINLFDAQILMLSIIANFSLAALIIYTGQKRLHESSNQIQKQQEELTDTITRLRDTSVSKRYTDRIIKSMLNMLIVMDEQHIIQTVNPATTFKLGYTQEELVGKSFSEIATIGLMNIIEAMVDQDSEPTVIDRDTSLITRNGVRLPVSVSLSVMHAEDNKTVEGIVCVAEDITQNKDIEDERMRNAMRYRALFEQTNDAIFIVDMKGNHLAANQRAVQLFGYTHQELTNMSFREIVVETEVSKSQNVLERLLNGEKVETYERIFKCKDGSEVVTEVSVELVRDNNNQPLHIQSVVRDISSRKTYELQLAQQAEMLESVSDAIIATDMNNVIQAWNRAAERVYGWKREEVIGRNLDEILPIENDTGQYRLGTSGDMEKNNWHHELIQRRKNGERIYVSSSVSMLHDGEGNARGMVAVNHDISRMKEVEADLQERIIQMKALRQIDVEIMSSLDVEDVLGVALNAAFILSDADAGFILLKEQDIFRFSESIGGYSDRITKGTVPRVYGIAKRVIDNMQGELITDVSKDPDYVVDLPDTHSIISIPLLSAGELIGLLHLESEVENVFDEQVFEYLNILAARIATGLTNARLHQLTQQQLDELRAVYNRVSSLEELKTDMIRIASHDLRNPIGIIRGYLAFIETDIIPRLSVDEADFIYSIAQAVDRMDEIIKELLSLERIEAMANQKPTDPIDLSALVNTIVKNSRRLAINKSQVFNTDIENDIVIEGDPAQLREAIFNLVENAIKYTPEKKTIDITLHVEDGLAEFRVDDTGYGVPEDQQSQLFTPFFRAASKETKTIKGTGLGLHLVKNIIERHNGVMIFNSVYGVGSTFGFKMPLSSQTISDVNKLAKQGDMDEKNVILDEENIDLLGDLD